MTFRTDLARTKWQDCDGGGGGLNAFTKLEEDCV